MSKKYSSIYFLLVSNNRWLHAYSAKLFTIFLRKECLESSAQTRMRPEISENTYQECVAGVLDATHVLRHMCRIDNLIL